MTKERSLAIEMWKGIRDMSSDEPTPSDVILYKRDFCEMNDLHWNNNCWLCQYIGCHKCPLKSCGRHSLYDVATSYYEDKDERVDACNGIIKALGGEV